MWKLIKSNTQDQVTLLNYTQGKIPTAIVRLGGTLTAPVGEIPKGGPDPRYVPDVSPVMVFFNYRRGVGADKTVPESERIARVIGNIGDLKSWIREQGIHWSPSHPQIRNMMRHLSWTDEMIVKIDGNERYCGIGPKRGAFSMQQILVNKEFDKSEEDEAGEEEMEEWLR